jgi:hypothetical protein
VGFSRVAYRQPFPSDRSSAAQYFPAVLCCHSRPESVGIFSFSFMGLISPFHLSLSILYFNIFFSVKQVMKIMVYKQDGKNSNFPWYWEKNF